MDWKNGELKYQATHVGEFTLVHSSFLTLALIIIPQLLLLSAQVILYTGQAVQLLHTARNCMAIGKLYEQSPYAFSMNSPISIEGYNMAANMNCDFPDGPLGNAMEYPAERLLNVNVDSL